MFGWLTNPYYAERIHPDNSKLFSTGPSALCKTDKFVLLEDIEQTYMGKRVVRTMERPVDKQTIDNFLAEDKLLYCGLIIDGYGCNQYRYRLRTGADDQK